MEKCTGCGNAQLLRHYDSGEIVCGNCGLVVQDGEMDEGPEWRAFTHKEEESRNRVGTPTSYSVHDKSLSTSIGRDNRDAFGRRLPLSTRIQMRRLRKWQHRTSINKCLDRNLVQAMTELDRLSDKVSAPSAVREKAALIYRRALREGQVRGRSISGIAASSLYAACRITDTPRNLRKISKESLVTKKEIARCYGLLVRKLDLHMPTDDPLIYIPRIAQRIGVSGNIETLAAEILKEVRKKRGLEGKKPKGVAAAALYIACLLAGDERTQKEISKASNITEATIGRSYRAIMKLSYKLGLHPLPPKWITLINEQK